MQTTEVKIDLLPDGVFTILLKDGQTVKGRFSTYALDRFCEMKGIDSFFTLVAKITMGMGMKDYADLVVKGLEDYFREDFKQCKWNTLRMMDEVIDPLGGMASNALQDLFKHAIGRVVVFSEKENEELEPDDNAGDTEKKSLLAAGDI